MSGTGTWGEQIDRLEKLVEEIHARLDAMEARMDQTEEEVKKLQYDYHHTTLPGIIRARVLARR